MGSLLGLDFPRRVVIPGAAAVPSDEPRNICQCWGNVHEQRVTQGLELICSRVEAGVKTVQANRKKTLRDEKII